MRIPSIFLPHRRPKSPEQIGWRSGTTPPAHADLPSLDTLEQYARELASSQREKARNVPSKLLFAQTRKSAHDLDNAYAKLSEVARKQLPLMPGEEWLLDNYPVVRNTTAEVAVDLPKSFYLHLPGVSREPWNGYPRVYLLASEVVLHSDGVIDAYNMEALISGYQSVTLLTMGELWAIPAMLRLALVEHLADLVANMLTRRQQFAMVDEWARRILKRAATLSDVVGATVQVPPDLASNKDLLTPTFVARFSDRLREAMPTVAPVFSWTERHLVDTGTSIEEAVCAEFNPHTAMQVSVSNTITSMQTVAAIDWPTFVERHSATETLLRMDPAGMYSHMDFATRDRYRQTVKRLSERSGKTEEQVAELAVECASSAQSARADSPRMSHVGYYLIDQGVYGLRIAIGYRSRLGERLSQVSHTYRTACYLAPIALVTSVIIGLALLFVMERERHLAPEWIVVALLLTLLPASEFAVRLVNQVITLLLRPGVLPKIDCSMGLISEYRTFVVIPTLLKTMEDVTALARHIELLYLANQDPYLHFAILSDFADAPREVMSTDAAILGAARAAVEELNARYGSNARFYLFHRKRQWNGGEGYEGKGTWMGWERKRGKLADFNALLRGAGISGGEQTRFIAQVGDLAVLPNVRYVITLDTDTRLPSGTACRLVGTLAHPLNRAELDPSNATVKAGYGILQPRVSTTWKSAGASLFSRIYSGHIGIDPYTSAVSDVYQDLFREGSYIGKGIYDVDAFAEATRNRFPPNRLLSHDLLEGAYARVGFASDIELYEDFPPRQGVYAAREHRWARGDWQIAAWLLPQVPSEHGRARNTLSVINRWKIFDNLRRSFVVPACLLLMSLAWTVLPGVGFFLTFGALVLFAFPVYSHLLVTTIGKPPAVSWSRHMRAMFADSLTNLSYFTLQVVFLVYRSYYLCDAIVRSLARTYVTHSHLLEWVTTNEVQQSLNSSASTFWRRMWISPVFALLLTVTVALVKPTSLPLAVPLLLAWAVAPWVAYRVSQPLVRRQYTPAEAEVLYLRRVARKSWGYFEDFVGPHDLWLAPDNFQEDPKGEVAHRTSPTNLGLLCLSTVSAYDLGYLTGPSMLARLESTLASMEGLERHNGHFYNWYDTCTGQPLPPRYISTVDSGNLAAHLLATKQGCLQMLEQPIFSGSLLAGLRDTLGIVSEELNLLQRERAKETYSDTDVVGILSLIAGIESRIQSTPTTLSARVSLCRSLRERVTELIAQTQQLHQTDRRGRAPVDGTNIALAADERAVGKSGAPSTELAWWSEKLSQMLEATNGLVDSFLPWAGLLNTAHPLLRSVHHPEIAQNWSNVVMSAGDEISFSGNLEWCVGCLAAISYLQKSIWELEDTDEVLGCIRWLEGLKRAVNASRLATRSLAALVGDVASKAERMSREMKFDFLFDESRKLFSIGYNVGELRRDNSYYDLLASEARLTSYLAIARGEVPQEHWFRLGRPITGSGDALTLLSWTGTMFEYLMPNLVMELYAGTLLAQASVGAVRHQRRYARSRGVPWGMSEATYNTLDAAQDYQYRAFGAPELALKHGLSEDVVVAPYATLLALTVDPRAALSNLVHLEGLGMVGRYGFYESVDFTRARLSPGERWAVIRTYMVHHIGMSLVGINNYVNGNPMVHRFGSEPVMASVELLLQERIPVQERLARHSAFIPHPLDTERQRVPPLELPPLLRTYTTPDTDVPGAHLISNGRYSVMLTNSGSGYSRWGRLSVTRWRNDLTRNMWGQFVYIQDVQSGALWSAASAPLGGKPNGYNVRFDLDKAEFSRRDSDIETRMEVFVSPEDDAEVRRVTLTNRGICRRVLEVTSYAEVALAPQAADEDAPTFSKLFVETEYMAERGALLASRRPRCEEEKRYWLVHVLAVERDDADTRELLSSPMSDEYETDRGTFLGRGNSVADPKATQGGPLEGNAGAVLDSIVSLRERVRLRPNTRITLSFVTAAAESRDQALSLADKYHDPARVARASMLSAARSRLDPRQRSISVEEAVQIQRLFSRMIYPRRGTRPPGEVPAGNSKGLRRLRAYGISGDLPILLVRVSDALETAIVHQTLRAHEYWLDRGFEVDVVVLNESRGSYIQPLQEELERIVAASHARDMLNRAGGVYVKRVDIMPEADRILLNSVARVILISSRGTLSTQLDREVPEPATPPM